MFKENFKTGEVVFDFTNQQERMSNKPLMILPDEDDKELIFLRKVRTCYIHALCNKETHLNIKIARTMARDLEFYSDLYCAACTFYFPIEEFIWDDGKKVGT